jgi:hypothetical protein
VVGIVLAVLVPDWRKLVRRFPRGAILLAALLPNALLGILNYTYNVRWFVGGARPDARHAFMRTQEVINCTAYPTGIAIGFLLAAPLSKGLGQLRRGENLPADQLPWLRRLCLRQGKTIAIISLAAWLIAGVGYMVILKVKVEQMELNQAVHFFASLALCGLTATAYAFFATTFLVVRAMYPVLVRAGSGAALDVQKVAELKWWMGFYLMVAASVPLLSMTTVVLIHKEVFSVILLLLGIGGFVGFAAAFGLAAIIRGDLDAMVEAVQPAEGS